MLSLTTDTLIFSKNTTTQAKAIHEEIKTENHASLLTNNEAEEDYYYDQDTTEDDINQKVDLEKVEADLENKAQRISSPNKDVSENDVKRSAEVINTENTLSATPSTLPVIAETNNYTNFTKETLALSTNTTTATPLNTTITTNNTNDTSDSNTPPTNTTTQKATYETGIVDSTTTLLPQAPDPKDDYKISHTLENVNKPEDLRREESEHRSRKSKGLSADYKVNRYINYSSESKNHLTRSTTEFEEPNISSERLSVQVG